MSLIFSFFLQAMLRKVCKVSKFHTQVGLQLYRSFCILFNFLRILVHVIVLSCLKVRSKICVADVHTWTKGDRENSRKGEQIK